MKWSFFSSMPLGLGLFVAVGLVSLVGSIVPAWANDIYGSWWFALLIGALVANTGLCTLRQFPLLIRGTWRQRVLVLLHASVLVVALGCGWGTFAFRSTTTTVGERGSFEVAGELWRLNQVEVIRYPDGSVSDWISTVTTPRGQVRIAVNQPAEWGDEKILQASYGHSYQVKLEADGTSTTLDLPQDTESPLTADGRVFFAISPPQDGLLAGAQDQEGLVPTVDLLLTSGGKILQKTALFVDVPLAMGDTGLVLTVTDARATSTFLLRHTPGLWLVWLGLALLALTVTVLMLLPRNPAPETHHE